MQINDKNQNKQLDACMNIVYTYRYRDLDADIDIIVIDIDVDIANFLLSIACLHSLGVTVRHTYPFPYPHRSTNTSAIYACQLLSEGESHMGLGWDKQMHLPLKLR